MNVEQLFACYRVLVKSVNIIPDKIQVEKLVERNAEPTKKNSDDEE